MKTKILLLASALFGAVLASHSQPLMKTHVETGDLEATADGGKPRNPPRPGAVC